MIPNRTGRVPKTEERRIREPPYVIDQCKLRRFDSKNIVFGRVMWDSSWEGYMRMYDEKVLRTISEGKSGYSRVDFALAYASWIVHDAFEGGFSWKKIKLNRTPAVSTGIDLTKTKYEVDDPYRMSNFIKRVARLFGASMVGVCKLNRDWLYADVDVPEKIENVIVMAVEMDADGIGSLISMSCVLWYDNFIPYLENFSTSSTVTPTISNVIKSFTTSYDHIKA